MIYWIFTRRSGRRIFAISASLLVAGCSAAGIGMGGQSPEATSASTGFPAPATAGWHVTTIEHVDLWLHGFALLTSDTGRVPFFARDYKQQMTVLKRQQNIFTQLDANQKELSARFATNPALANAQFLAMYFPSLQEIVRATDLLVRSGGNPRAASDPQSQQEIALLAATFPSPADRDWARRFVLSLQDEDTRFYHTYWTSQQQVRGAAFAAFQEAWMSKYYPALSRFLNNTQQEAGQVVLSLPLGGEGRTINDGKQSNVIAVEFPKTIDAAPEAFFVVAHEAVAKLVSEAIRDNTTPAEQRSGVADGYTGNSAVRCGALLLKRVDPQVEQAYMRFYLQALGRRSPSGDPSAAFVAAFPVPKAILDAVDHQIGIILSGI